MYFRRTKWKYVVVSMKTDMSGKGTETRGKSLQMEHQPNTPDKHMHVCFNGIINTQQCNSNAYAGEGCLEVLAPNTGAVNASHNHSAILIDNADGRPCGIPLHVPHNTLVAVVDHLLSPVALQIKTVSISSQCRCNVNENDTGNRKVDISLFKLKQQQQKHEHLVEDPDDNEAGAVACGELAVVCVPGNGLHTNRMALQSLVHRHVARRRRGASSDARSGSGVTIVI